MEPVDLQNTTFQVPDRLQKIITVLENYHRRILQENTNNSQHPDHADKKVKSILEQKGRILKLCLLSKENCSELNDSDILQTLDALREPWDPTISTLLMSYIDDLFFNCPLTHTVQHCRRLREYAKEYNVQLDG